MTATAPCSSRVVPVESGGESSRLAAWLHALAMHLERRADRRARRRLVRRAAHDLRALDDATLADLGIRREQVERVGDGMLGPPLDWRGLTGGL